MRPIAQLKDLRNMNKKVTDSRIKYLLHIPEGYKTQNGKKWPLIIFLHGLGERGNNLQLISRVGLPKKLKLMPQFPFFVVSPQCSLRTYWDREKQAVMVKEIIDSVISNYAIDDSCVYLTGYSMGGYGTWFITALFPDLFAAIAPICGGANPDIADKIAHVPTWVFHGVLDTVVSIKKSYSMVDALKKAGNRSIHYTFYPDLEHNCWDKTYSNMELYQWFLRHTKEKSKCNEIF